MAEFQEVMRQYDRMCSHYEECADCPFHRNVVWCIKKIGGKRYVNENARSAEELIMSWAAEHPERMKTTWGEYLCNIGLIPDCTESEDVVLRLFNNVIPTDIAQKLEIEPKEDT